MRGVETGEQSDSYEQIEPRFKKVRGRNKDTLALIEAMKKIAEEAKPITGRGIGYKLFTAGLIKGMDEMNIVYRALKVAREDGTIPWDWIVDETRELESVETEKSSASRRRVLLPTRSLADPNRSKLRCGLRRARCAAWCGPCWQTGGWLQGDARLQFGDMRMGRIERP